MSRVTLPAADGPVAAALRSRADELGLLQQAHAARAVHVEMRHDHPLDVAGIDAEPAQLRIEWLVRRSHAAKQHRHAEPEVGAPALQGTWMQARIDDDRAGGGVPDDEGEQGREQRVATGAQNRGDVGEAVSALRAEDHACGMGVRPATMTLSSTVGSPPASPLRAGSGSRFST